MIDAALLEPDKAKQKRCIEEIQRYAEVVPAIQPFSQAVDSVAYRGDVKNLYHYAWTTRFRDVAKGR